MAKKSERGPGERNPHEFRVSPGMRQGMTSASPLPTQLVSNEEYNPLPPSPAQLEVERRINTTADCMARRLGIDRRAFLRSTGGMAAAFLAMNEVFGDFFDVRSVEAAEPSAFRERGGPTPFVIDLQTHYVGKQYDPKNAEAKRKGAVTKQQFIELRSKMRTTGANPALDSDSKSLADLGWENFVKEVFLDSDTMIGLISTPPGPYPHEAVVPPKQMTHIRDEINRITKSQRMLAHGLLTPQLGKADLDFMDQQAGQMKVDAWKAYTGSAPKGFDRGWFMDDEKIAYPMLERARKLKVPIVCVHKGLPLGPVQDFNHPRDIIKAAKDFPDLTFILYHSGFKTVDGVDKVFAQTGAIPWTTEFCQMKKAEPKISNIYMELGGVFAQLISMQPAICAHLLGQLLDAFGADHVVWGTDSIWYGSPQWQIQAFRRFQFPQVLIDKHKYPALTNDVKAAIFANNAARLFGIDLQAKRNEVPKDYLSKVKLAYQDAGPLPSHRKYGWVSGGGATG
jgi:predicted TIM-barrel fold metal-dependent hydrolase